MSFDGWWTRGGERLPCINLLGRETHALVKHGITSARDSNWNWSHKVESAFNTMIRSENSRYPSHARVLCALVCCQHYLPVQQVLWN